METVSPREPRMQMKSPPNASCATRCDFFRRLWSSAAATDGFTKADLGISQPFRGGGASVVPVRARDTLRLPRPDPAAPDHRLPEQLMPLVKPSELLEDAAARLCRRESFFLAKSGTKPVP